MKIHTLVLTGALVLPGLAFAADTAKPNPSTDTSMQHDSSMKHSKSDKSMKKDQHSAAFFEDKDNFNVEGTVQRVEGKKLTLAREDTDLPPVALQIPADAEIMIDGEKSQISKIQKGSDVRATFNIVNNQPLAVKLDVTSSKDQPSSKSMGTDTKQKKTEDHDKAMHDETK